MNYVKISCKKKFRCTIYYILMICKYHFIHFIIYKLNVNLKKDDLSQLELFLINYFFFFLARQIIVKISKKKL